MALPMNSLVNFRFNGKNVGDGIVKKRGAKSKLHGTALPEGHYGVQVDSVYAEHPVPLHFLLPMEEDITTLQEAINTIVAWPIVDLVNLLCFTYKYIELQFALFL